MKISKIQIVVIVALLVAVVCILITKNSSKDKLNQKNNTTVSATSSEQAPISIDEFADSLGIISTSTNGNSSYTSKKFGISFLCPGKGWYVGDNHLGYGTFQLSNYDPVTADGKDFGPASANKIEAGISKTNSYGTSTDYPEKERTSKKITIASQNVNVFDIQLVGGQKLRAYFVPLPTTSDEYISMTIYGNEQNFHVLDEIVNSIKFSEVR